jgi:hypothetical protein
MQKLDPKTRCDKRTLSKAVGVCRLYSKLQSKYADILQASDDIKEIRCNYPMDGLDIGEYTSDFVCLKQDGEYMIRECLDRRHLTKPLTIRLLDASREYWRLKGVSDWGIVIDQEATNV